MPSIYWLLVDDIYYMIDTELENDNLGVEAEDVYASYEMFKAFILNNHSKAIFKKGIKQTDDRIIIGETKYVLITNEGPILLLGETPDVRFSLATKISEPITKYKQIFGYSCNGGSIDDSTYFRIYDNDNDLYVVEEDYNYYAIKKSEIDIAELIQKVTENKRLTESSTIKYSYFMPEIKIFVANQNTLP